MSSMVGRRPGDLRAQFFWAILAALALYWPGRFLSPLDGLPLDGKSEALLLGLLLPMLCWLHPAALRAAWARGLIASLLAWKLIMALSFTQEGWCTKFLTSAPLVDGGTRVQQSWDVRTGWPCRTPACSAIAAHPYEALTDFPVWFVNLLEAPMSHAWLRVGTAGPRPPRGALEMQVNGYLTTDTPGRLAILIGDAMRVEGSVGQTPLVSKGRTALVAHLEPGVHPVRLTAMLSGTSWKFVPLWNGKETWAAALTTVEAPSAVDRTLWSVGRWVAPLLIVLLVLGWLTSYIIETRPSVPMVLWTVGASVGMALAGLIGQGQAARAATVALFGSLAIPLAHRLQNLRGAFWLIGVPWLSLLAAHQFWQIGRFTLYSIGDDWLNYQVYAHRIFMQGDWLVGGEAAFYDQPLYRWINGVLHLVFGDSSVGELYWDAASLLIGALFCFYVVKRLGGFRWGLAAAVTTLTTFALGPVWYLIGRGLSEIAATGFTYLAAFCVLRARRGPVVCAAVAGLLATLMWYTRPNYLPLAIALAALFLPVAMPARQWLSGFSLLRRVPHKPLFMYLAVVALGLVVFAARTWLYTGHFSVFYGTRLTTILTGLGPSTLLSAEAWRKAMASLLAVLTVQDSPLRLDPRGWVVLSGSVCALLALLRVPFFNRLPLGPGVVCLGAMAFALLVHGWGYPGRFSVHLIPAATAMALCAVVLIAHRGAPHLWSSARGAWQRLLQAHLAGAAP